MMKFKADCNGLLRTSVQEFSKKHFGDRQIPLSGGFELTNRCNLRCVHCYAKTNGKKRELTTEQIKRIIDQLAEAGTLSLFFTGGEPMLRKDFLDIYKYTRDKGILVSVYSNATLLDQESIKIFQEYPLVTFSTTMYGYTKEVYESVTGVNGSFELFHAGLRLLLDHKIPFDIKAVALTLNCHEIFAMKEFAKGKNIPFAYYTSIRATNDGDTSPTNYRISVEDIFRFDIEDTERHEFWEQYTKDILLNPPEPKRKGCLYPCNIGKQGFFITSESVLTGCTKERFRGNEILSSSFSDEWEKFPEIYFKPQASQKTPCVECKYSSYCPQCTADFELENGDPSIPISCYCALASKRFNYFMSKAKGGDYD